MVYSITLFMILGIMTFRTINRLALSLEGTLCQILTEPEGQICENYLKKVDWSPSQWRIPSELYEKFNINSPYRKRIVRQAELDAQFAGGKPDYNGIDPKNIDRGYEFEGSYVVFRQNIHLLEPFKGASTPFIVSLHGSNVIRRVSEMLPAIGVNISNCISISDDQKVVGSDPICLIDDSLESIAHKMPHLPKGSVYLLTDRFEVHSNGFQFHKALNAQGDVISHSFKKCLKQFEYFRQGFCELPLV